MSGPSGAVDVRVLSYNVRSLRDDRAAVASVIRAVRPDVACIQEAPRFLRWRSKCAALARDSDLLTVTGGRTAGAVLLLAGLRAGALRTDQVLLPKRPGLHQRGVAMAVFEIGGARLAVATTHLSLDAGERVEQARRAADLLAGLGEPAAVLAGDVNDVPGSPAWGALTRAGLRDAYAEAPWGEGPTFPASGPTRRIDGIFASAGVVIRRCGVPPDLPGVTAASDHRPVLAELTVPA